MDHKNVFEKAYGNMPKEIGYTFSADILPFRGVKYYYLKLVRYFTR